MHCARPAASDPDKSYRIGPDDDEDAADDGVRRGTRSVHQVNRETAKGEQKT